VPLKVPLVFELAFPGGGAPLVCAYAKVQESTAAPAARAIIFTVSSNLETSIPALMTN
jgi:hypothetical protein